MNHNNYGEDYADDSGQHERVPGEVEDRVWNHEGEEQPVVGVVQRRGKRGERDAAKNQRENRQRQQRRRERVDQPRPALRARFGGGHPNRQNTHELHSAKPILPDGTTHLSRIQQAEAPLFIPILYDALIFVLEVPLINGAGSDMFCLVHSGPTVPLNLNSRFPLKGARRDKKTDRDTGPAGPVCRR